VFFFKFKPKQVFGRIIGVRGETVDNIKKNCGVFIHLEPFEYKLDVGMVSQFFERINLQWYALVQRELSGMKLFCSFL